MGPVATMGARSPAVRAGPVPGVTNVVNHKLLVERALGVSDAIEDESDRARCAAWNAVLASGVEPTHEVPDRLWFHLASDRPQVIVAEVVRLLADGTLSALILRDARAEEERARALDLLEASTVAEVYRPGVQAFTADTWRRVCEAVVDTVVGYFLGSPRLDARALGY